MNVLLADDEFLVRSSLKSMLLELDMGVHIVAEACDGEELVTKVKKYSPDLVFVDIKMPKLDGLNAIRGLKAQCPDVAWIVLTGFPVFEYAKEAMELQVKKYLLKPVSMADLRDAVDSVFQDSLERLRKRNFEFEHDLSALINRYSEPDSLDPRSVLLTCHFLGAILLRDSCEKSVVSAAAQKQFCGLLSDQRDRLTDSQICSAFLPLGKGVFAVVFAWDPGDGRNARKKAESLLAALIGSAQKTISIQGGEAVLYGSECTGFAELLTQLEAMQRMIPLKTTLCFQESVCLDSLMQKRSCLSLQALRISELLYSVVSQYCGGSSSEFSKSVDQLEFYFTSNGLTLEEAAPFRAVLQCLVQTDLISDVPTLVRALRALGEQSFGDVPAGGDLVDRAILFISSNYMHNIGIAQIASLLKVTPNYLSALFHKKTGESYMRFLTRTRMQKARELLLASENPRIGQVSRQVGYYTVNYFTKLYKEYFGISPSQDFVKNRHARLHPPS